MGFTVDCYSKILEEELFIFMAATTFSQISKHCLVMKIYAIICSRIS